MEETLIEKLKQYYFDYRRTSEPEDSFSLAMQTMPHYVIGRIGELSRSGDMEGIRDVIRQYEEFDIAPAKSNDSVQERFEEEYLQARQVH